MLGVDGTSEKEYAVKKIQTHDNITRCRFKGYEYHVHHTVHAYHICQQTPYILQPKQAREKHTSISFVTHSYSVGQVQRMEMSSSGQ